MGQFLFPALILCMAAAQAQTPCEAPCPTLRLNEIQVIGTHNSYHVRPSDAAMAVMRGFTRRVDAWDYTHPPLDVQLDRGVRSFELDLQWRDERWEVFHVPGIDEGSTCPFLDDCLSTVRAWSMANPGHVPISFLLEIKNDGVQLDHRITTAPAEALDLLDTQIRAIFPEEVIITPDRVRGDAHTLEAAVTTLGWPRLEEVRGAVMFILHDRGLHRGRYTEGRPSLEGRAMFVRSDPGRPDAATLVMDHPDPAAIQPVVRAGYMVRTRADANLRYSESRRQAALESGAHIVTTDFPPGSPSRRSGYTVAFEDEAPARMNPVLSAR